MKVKNDSNKLLTKQESRTLLEKEFEKANYIINMKMKELTTEKFEKTIVKSKLKGEEKVLDVKSKHLVQEYEDKDKEHLGLNAEIKKLEEEINNLKLEAKDNLNIVKEKRILLAEIKKNKGMEFSNKKNDCATENQKSKDELLEQKMKINSIVFSNQIKKEEVEKLKSNLKEIERQYNQALNFEAQGVKKAASIFKDLRNN